MLKAGQLNDLLVVLTDNEQCQLQTDIVSVEAILARLVDTLQFVS